jgi:uncharacterized protein (TIGR02270 family)
VLEEVVEQHAEEAAFLWTQRDRACEAPNYRSFHLSRLDERVEAHVDGLRVAGEGGWRIALEQLQRRCGAGELFAAGVQALESGESDRIERLVGRAQAEQETRRGFVGAIAWCRPSLLATTVRNWNASSRSFSRYLALCAGSVHRAEPGHTLAERIFDDHPRVRARALRLAGELGKIEHRALCVRRLNEADDSEERFWSAWSTVLLGDRDAGLQMLVAMALDDGPHRWNALEVAVRAMGSERGVGFIREVSRGAAAPRAIITAIGHLGDPAAVPWLIERMRDATLARTAGAAFAMITGADLDEEKLTRPGEAVAVPNDDPADNRIDGAMDEDLGWPDPALVRRWWELRQHKWAPGSRYLCGNRADALSKDVLEVVSQQQRRSVCLEAKLQSAATPLINWKERCDRAGARGQSVR